MVSHCIYHNIYFVNCILIYINKLDYKFTIISCCINAEYHNLVTIFIGIFFDIIGVAVTVADENEFHAKASKRIAGSKTSVKLIRNSAKVANFCADVIGDICGVLSGSISASIALKITASFGITFNLQFLISALVASLTVSGKAIGKTIAQKSATKIVHAVAVVLNKLHLNQK